MEYTNVIKKLAECPDILAVALGGSRSRGTHRKDSDFDLFCVIVDANFVSFRNSFRYFLEDIQGVLIAAEASYLENWGYLFKAIDNHNICYDISIIPRSRISEMGVRSTNVVIKDTDGFYQDCIDQADDECFKVSNIETRHLLDYSALFGFEAARLDEAIKNNDYWYAVRCLERMKNHLIRCDRIQREMFSKTCSCPEKEYTDIDDCIKKAYSIDGTLESLGQTGEKLVVLFTEMIQDVKIQRRSQLLC